MKLTIHKSNTRGFYDYGWLKTNHTFSFSQYFDPERKHFGCLRVLNDDYIAPNSGFDEHPHSNMEIVSIMLSGILTHKDSEGNQFDITPGEIQIMSAGSGIYHSEYNNQPTEWANLLQLWIYPSVKNIQPRYGQMRFDSINQKNVLHKLVAPQGDNVLNLNQNAYIYTADFTAGHTFEYKLSDESMGVYIFIVDGDIEIDSQVFSKRDGIGISETQGFQGKSISESKVVFIEIPMSI
jgi:quercetin 2,3-dioxygenase